MPIFQLSDDPRRQNPHQGAVDTVQTVNSLLGSFVKMMQNKRAIDQDKALRTAVNQQMQPLDASGQPSATGVPSTTVTPKYDPTTGFYTPDFQTQDPEKVANARATAWGTQTAVNKGFEPTKIQAGPVTLENPNTSQIQRQLQKQDSDHADEIFKGFNGDDRVKTYNEISPKLKAVLEIAKTNPNSDAVKDSIIKLGAFMGLNNGGNLPRGQISSQPEINDSLMSKVNSFVKRAQKGGSISAEDVKSFIEPMQIALDSYGAAKNKAMDDYRQQAETHPWQTDIYKSPDSFQYLKDSDYHAPEHNPAGAVPYKNIGELQVAMQSGKIQPGTVVKFWDGKKYVTKRVES